jgi:hypothetical protein
MKFIFLLSCCFIFLRTNGQKYVLLDETMSAPPSYADAVTIIDKSEKIFAIEKSSLPIFLNMIDTLSELIQEKCLARTFDLYLGKQIKFHIIKMTFKKEDRMDAVVTSDCGAYMFSMHLCDVRLSNSFNFLYLKSWANYIKGNLK